MSVNTVDPIRLLVVARHPLRLDDRDLDGLPDVEEVQLIQRHAALNVAFEKLEPNLVIMDVTFPEGRSFPATDRARAFAPDVRILALTPDPPSHDAVARALRTGAPGFIDINATLGEFAAAVRSVHASELWSPPDETRAILGSVAEDLDGSHDRSEIPCLARQASHERSCRPLTGRARNVASTVTNSTS